MYYFYFAGEYMSRNWNWPLQHVVTELEVTVDEALSTRRKKGQAI